jgi:putative aminopeptidase FrvX
MKSHSSVLRVFSRGCRECFARLVLLCAVAMSLATLAAAQDLRSDLAKFAETPAVVGYERALAAEIRAELKKFSPQTDNMGNVYVTLGSGAPRRLIVAPMDEPGYIVSAVIPDGYLRVQRLPQTAPHPFFDLLHASQPVVIWTRKGKAVSGVVAGLSTHLQPARQNPPRGGHPDEIYIDIGAQSAAEVRQAGVDVLDPIALERKPYEMGADQMTAPSIGDRFGCAALVELLRALDAAKVRGTLTVALVTQQWADGRGLDRLTQHVQADELIYVGRLLPRRPVAGAAARPNALPPRQPKRMPGEGVSIGTAEPEAALKGFPAELKQLADANKIPAATDFSVPLVRSRYTQGPVLPERFTHLSVPTRFTATPAEFMDFGDLEGLVSLLEVYAQGSAIGVAPRADAAPSATPKAARPKTAPSATEILKNLVETYGVSGHEEAVRKEVERLLPPWAKPKTDSAGNLVLHLGSAAKGSKAPRLAFVAHMDEIGYAVRTINPDGTLEVQSRGGGIREFFDGHAVLVHTASGQRPGVLELPVGWDQPGFEWPRRPLQPGEVTVHRVDVGAHNAAEVEKLGIKVGDPITVPKKYRKLIGTRANGRSFDDRVGCASLLAAVWALGPSLPGRDVTFIWSTDEEVGLRGALTAAQQMAKDGKAPDYVFAVDTFVSSDSPLESKRIADAPIGRGFVIRAVDNSNITERAHVDKLVALARANKIPVQYGVTGGGNDGSVFLRQGSVNVPLSWPLRYSHSPGEVIDTRDLDALARIIAAVARSW